MTKKCKDCNAIKKQENFYGMQGECKECTKKRIKKSARNITKECKQCKKKFGTCISEINRNGGKFCSRNCLYKWNTKGNNYIYKGDKAGYHAKHKWITKKLGSPKYCEHCKQTNKKHYHWSNKSNKYLLDISDWQRLCVKCHSKYDKQFKKEIIINCIICDKQITTTSKKRKFCSTKCSSKFYRDKRK